MNFLDTLDPKNPASWQNRIQTRSVDPAMPMPIPMAKRFSMNYYDTLDNTDPESWTNKIGGKAKRPRPLMPLKAGKPPRPLLKRFSMNYLDTLDSNDPSSWSNIMVNKRFSMNYLGEPLQVFARRLGWQLLCFVTAHFLIWVATLT